MPDNLFWKIYSWVLHLILFKIDAFLQGVVFTLEISAALFKNFIPNIRELFISEGVLVTISITMEKITN